MPGRLTSIPPTFGVSMSMLSSRRASLIGVILTLFLVSSALSPVTAKEKKGPSEKDLKVAERQLERARKEARSLGNQISSTRARVANLRSEVARLRGQLSVARAEYDRALATLADTESEQAAIEADQEELLTTMDDRARSAFIAGPTGGLEFLLGSGSLTEMSERSTFLDALQAQDANSAARLQKLRHDLQAVKHRKKLAAKEAGRLLSYLTKQQDQLQVKIEEQNGSIADLNRQLHAARVLEKKWGVKVNKISEKLNTAVVGGNGPLYACPLPDYTWLSDDWLAPRVGHLHQGNDIGGPYGADVIAPFDGKAVASSDSLGGITVKVYGKDGYVYMAHLSKIAKTGRVDAGEVVGYNGDSGNAQGTSPHVHFEWHPGNGDAVDPHEYLLEVCRR